MATNSSLLADVRLSNTGAMQDNVCLSIMISLIDCSECFNEGFTGMVMSCDRQFRCPLFNQNASRTAVRSLSISRNGFKACLVWKNISSCFVNSSNASNLALSVDVSVSGCNTLDRRRRAPIAVSVLFNSPNKHSVDFAF